MCQGWNVCPHHCCAKQQLRIGRSLESDTKVLHTLHTSPRDSAIDLTGKKSPCASSCLRHYAGISLKQRCYNVVGIGPVPCSIHLERAKRKMKYCYRHHHVWSQMCSVKSTTYHTTTEPEDSMVGKYPQVPRWADKLSIAQVLCNVQVNNLVATSWL